MEVKVIGKKTLGLALLKLLIFVKYCQLMVEKLGWELTFIMFYSGRKTSNNEFIEECLSYDSPI